MPKGGRSGKNSAKGTPKRTLPGLRAGKRNGAGSDDDDSYNGGDCASILSLCSDRGSFEDVIENGNTFGQDGTTDINDSSRENLEEKLGEWIEDLTEKSASARSGALTSLTSTFSSRLVPHMIENHRETLRDNLEKIVKRGQKTEQGSASTVLSLLSLQFGSLDVDLATEDFNALRQTFQTLLLDHTATIPVRVKACDALCMGAFLAESSLDDISNILRVIEPLFTLNNAKTVEAEQASSKLKNGSLAAAAIGGWSLLITLMPSEFLLQKAKKWIDTLKRLLDDSELEVRLNAGEAIALLVEICELEDSTEESSSSSSGSDEAVQNVDRINMKGLISKLRELSVQSHKYQAKRDRRQQRHNFRDYLHAVEDGDGPGQSIKFGNGEVLELSSWVKKRQYDALCHILGSGMNRHLVENGLVRQILELGDPRPIAVDIFGGRNEKAERQFINSANFKARCLSRGKSRDIRMANLTDY